MSKTPNEKEAKKHCGILSTLKRLVMCEPKPQKEQEAAEDKEQWTSELFVYFTNGDIHSWKYTGKDTGVKPWRHFYTWWFSRNSDSYVFRYEGGERMIKRDLIKSFRLARNDT